MSDVKNILDLCGGTGSWSAFYRDNGYNVINVTLPDYDIRNFVVDKDMDVYGILAAPPCTEFSFCRTNAKVGRNLVQGLDLVKHCLRIIWDCQLRIESDLQKRSPLKFWCLENPNGMLKWFLGLPVMEFQPYEFGDNYKKKTHLWGYFQKPVKNIVDCDKPKFDKLLTKEIHGEFYGIYDRTTRRSITPKGFAKAFFEANR